MYFSSCLPRLTPLVAIAQSSHSQHSITKFRRLALGLGQCQYVGVTNRTLKVPDFVKARSFHSSGGSLHNNQLESNNPGNKPQVLPTLMDFPRLQWPTFINTIRNWFFVYFIIKPHMDPEFDLREFMSGVKEAVSIVSHKLSKGEWDDLEGLVDESTLSTLKSRLSTFSVLQRELLAVNSNDVFFAFPYQIGIIIPESDSASEATEWREDTPEPKTRPPQKRFVEITVVLHVLKGFAERQVKGDMKSLKEFLQDEPNDVMVCNYRFFRDFTTGVKSPEWIINMLNHFLPADHMDLKK